MFMNAGKPARDKVTGFQGVITARIEYLTGCAQYGIAPPAKDGKVENTQYFDETRVEILAGASVMETPTENPGGPSRDCPA